MTGRDCIITVITHFLFKNGEGNSKWNVGTSVDYRRQTITDQRGK